MEEIIQLLEQVESNLKARNYDKIVVASVVKLNVAMKSYGSQVELVMFNFDSLHDSFVH